MTTSQIDKKAEQEALYAPIHNTKFHRKIIHSIYQYNQFLRQTNRSFYTQDEIDELERTGVADRLPPRATEYYMELAMRSDGIRNLIKARPEEMADLSGERDPSNQLKYCHVDGMLHKYELILLYVARACSSWCRYCYRSDFLTNKTEKDIADPQEVAAYVKQWNKEAAEDIYAPVNERKMPIREALLSGGDPMVMSNRNMFHWLHSMAEAGLTTVRIGTKELAFFPQRFDHHFFEMLDYFHKLHPNMNLSFMVHFTHPDELLMLTEEGHYVPDDHGRFKRNPIVEHALKELRSRSFIALENQTPIIDSVNDDADVLRLLQVELRRLGVRNHYFFQCREIEGHKAFAVPVEKAWKLHRDSQIGLSGVEKSRFALSTEAGKLEMISVIDGLDVSALPDTIPAIAKAALGALLKDGLVVFRMHRAARQGLHGDLVIARRNPDALWITGYEDRLLYDGRTDGPHQAYKPLLEQLAGALDSASGNDRASTPILDFLKHLNDDDGCKAA